VISARIHVHIRMRTMHIPESTTQYFVKDSDKIKNCEITGILKGEEAIKVGFC
jgi:hypothetical protein